MLCKTKEGKFTIVVPKQDNEGNNIFIRNYVLFEEYYDEVIQGKPFTVDNCYDFIWPKEPKEFEPGREMSEWIVELED